MAAHPCEPTEDDTKVTEDILQGAEEGKTDAFVVPMPFHEKRGRFSDSPELLP